jgi:hypothetical protein
MSHFEWMWNARPFKFIGQNKDKLRDVLKYVPAKGKMLRTYNI